MPQPLDGPRSEPQGAATALVVLLHGYGANGDDLIALADGWRRRLPQAAPPFGQAEIERGKFAPKRGLQSDWWAPPWQRRACRG